MKPRTLPTDFPSGLKLHYRLSLSFGWWRHSYVIEGSKGAMEFTVSEYGKERNELREAILELGYLTGTEGYCGDHVVLTVRLTPREADTWNALVAKLRAETDEPKT